MIPQVIKIGIYDYKVIQMDTPIILRSDVCNGLIDYEKLEIQIMKDMPEQKKLQVLWHEIFHGIIREWGVDINGSDEENKVDWLAIGMVQIIKDNPGLFAPSTRPKTV